ncbi:MAG: hypothetical protein KatS3mg122_3190 [Caldimonas sp.]|nr:MAG: hypothetical protein KatS3mg122_3190 [Caldimonas sp.]
MLARLFAPQIDALIERLRRVLALGVEVAVDRVTLAQLEWQDEKRRLARLFVNLLAAVWLAGLTVSFLGALVIIACWDTPWRVAAAAGVVLVLGVGAAWAVFQVRRLLEQGDQAFALLRRELAADLETLRRLHEGQGPAVARPAPTPPSDDARPWTPESPPSS